MVSGAASGGASRALIAFHVIHSSWGTPKCAYRMAEGLRMQVFLVTLIRKLAISRADHHPQIKRDKSVLAIPLVLGEEDKGTRLRLKINVIRNG